MLAVAAFLGLSFAMSPAATTDAQGAGCIKISRVYFDSPGSDTGSNTSLNAEWIQLRNGCASGKSLNGWTVRDTSSHVYRFDAYRLRAGGYVKIHPGNGADTAGHRYWDADGYGVEQQRGHREAQERSGNAEGQMPVQRGGQLGRLLTVSWRPDPSQDRVGR